LNFLTDLSCLQFIALIAQVRIQLLQQPKHTTIILKYQTMVRQRIKFCGNDETNFDGKLHASYYPNFIDNERDQAIIQFFMSNLPWSRVEYPMYGKTRVTPRMTWCFGRINDRIVKYRGKQFETQEMPLWLANIRDAIASKTGFMANAAILNYYPTGNDHINWHADDEKFLDEKTVASISFNAERVFSMRNTDYRFDITLRHGSLLMMYDGTEHCLDAQKDMGPRFNITLRRLNDEKGVGNYYYYNRGLNHAL
jgi:alkylated DNA repair dioxygenase AlkB